MTKTETFQKLRLIDRIGRNSISPGAAALLSYVQRVQRSRKWHFASGDALAAALKCSRRSILRYVAELERVGLLAVWRRVLRCRTETGRIEHRKAASGYRVLSDKLAALADLGASLRHQTVSAAKRAQALAQRVAACCKRMHSCDNVAQRTRPEYKKDAERRALFAQIGAGVLVGTALDDAWRRVAELEAMP